ncbi:hypothetical protein A0J61_01094 [Choanephora cucurbitarum]|uniref:Uncharacterized protein n=1 Tax=Choanephora cucurbitarum TaxID=101091 RepID=A0A1C7NPL9_9FUNG|nr:hypothetical protein A0J61_01094 [Choanephora cucurbitarum]
MLRQIPMLDKCSHAIKELEQKEICIQEKVRTHSHHIRGKEEGQHCGKSLFVSLLYYVFIIIQAKDIDFKTFKLLPVPNEEDKDTLTIIVYVSI